MNRYHIVITENAENDLKGIANYIAVELREPTTAQHMVTKIGEAILSLEEMPFRNALITDEKLSSKGIRKLLIENYIVFYVISQKNVTVIIIRILLNRRNWNNLL